MKKVLVIAAHPDDEVMGLGGTIAKLSAQGVECHLLIVTDGSSSQYRDSGHLHEIIEAKKKETKECSDLLGFKSINYGELPDMKLDTTPHIRINQVIEDVIDKVQPDTVFTNFWGDVNLDHQEVYKSTLVAVRPVMGQVVKELYCYRVPSSTEWMPNKELKRQLDASRPRESVKDKIAEKQDLINSSPVKGGIAHGKEQSR